MNKNNIVNSVKQMRGRDMRACHRMLQHDSILNKIIVFNPNVATLIVRKQSRKIITEVF